MAAANYTPGVDVSNHQGKIDWSLVAGSGQKFAIIKASEGIDFTDSFFSTNWAGTRHFGLVRGAYHYARPSVNDPQPEADYFLAIIAANGGLQQGDIVALDMEDPNVPDGVALQAWTTTWLQYVEGKVGFKPLFYSGHYYMAPHQLENNNDLAQYGLWLASYQSAEPTAPPNWPFWAIWQHADQSSVLGINGSVDLNLFNGNIERLKLYGKP